MEQLNKQSSDSEVMAEFENLRAQACGETIGHPGDTPTEAARNEGWDIIRVVYGSTNVPGTPVLAEDPSGNLWVVDDLDGPWAIQIAEARNAA